MAKDGVDTRKLKDQVAELLKKSKWEKASELLEQLVRLEPKDMAHRLKLGDAYRRQDHIQKSVASYQAAAKSFADEGQLIKAIGAVKVILEIDPRNEEAQKQLAEMNNRRFAKPTLESAGLKPARGIGAGARATSAIELAEGQHLAGSIAAELSGGAPDDDEPLELDDGKPTPPRRAQPPPAAPAIPHRGFQAPPVRTAAPPAREHEAYELDDGSGALDYDMPAPAAPPQGRPPGAQQKPQTGAQQKPPPGAQQKPLPRPPPPAKPKAGDGDEIAMELGDGEMEPLPDDAILTPSAEDLAARADDEAIALDEDVKPAASAAAGKAASAAQPPARTASAAPPAGKPLVTPPPPSATPRPPAPRAPQVTVSEEITFEEESVPSRPPLASTRHAAAGPARPIADLLSSESEEEIELLSISSDDEVADRPITGPRLTPDEADFDSAFGSLSPAAAPPKKRPPPRKVPLFDDLSQDAFVELVNKLSYHRHVPGQLIIKEGDPGRSFFVIVEGKVRIFKSLEDGKELTLAHLGEGAFFGEMALLSGAPRTANVVAEEDTEILEVTDVVLRELAQNHPQVVHSLKNFYRQRLLNNVMAISPLFKDFDPGERKAIVEKFKMRQAAPGEALITEGRNSDGLYVVLHGAVNVAARKDDKSFELARLKEGEIFGEMSLLTRKPASATVTSQGNSILLKLPREHFQELVLTHPQILELVSELTEKRKSATEAILSGQGPGHDGMSFV